jgi:hypothetical protein
MMMIKTDNYSVQNISSSSSLFKNIKMYRAIISPVVLYGCETLSLIQWEECRLRVFANRVLRTKFWPKRDEVTLHNNELHAMYCSPNITRVIKSRRMRWAGHVAGTVERRGAYSFREEN